MAEVRNWRQRRRLVLVAAFLLIALAGVLLLYRPLAVAYHRWRMDAALAKMRTVGFEESVIVPEQWWNPLTGTTTRAAQDYYIEQYERSRDRLAELSYFRHREFHLKHILVSTPESRRFWQLVRDRFPDSVHTTMNWASADDPEPAVLSVWARPERISEWERFVARYDVPDLLEHLRSHEGGEVE